MNFAEYITPTKAQEIGDTRSLGELQSLSRSRAKCEVCRQPAWKFAGTGMCFTCTTGESDASEDYELVEENEHGNK
jgi:hypothetical protein